MHATRNPALAPPALSTPPFQSCSAPPPPSRGAVGAHREQAAPVHAPRPPLWAERSEVVPLLDRGFRGGLRDPHTRHHLLVHSLPVHDDRDEVPPPCFRRLSLLEIGEHGEPRPPEFPVDNASVVPRSDCRRCFGCAVGRLPRVVQAWYSLHVEVLVGEPIPQARRLQSQEGPDHGAHDPQRRP
eukprot:CAMPEP_0180174474 /NCGR_PEP_ID=MMETSP0986-20121125/36172_1 /TAXON_ID=697907 /ORGANISM="non described non described, Strain CCMP2293" /LENGTH=183 /DNA_ID=CAMNT_0022126819 /DNA_START=273 /DNA_END=824 /DNA_ORIENTATION=-